MPFSDFSGYEAITGVFRRVITREAYHSAYLFHGPPQVGKRRLAQAFASAIFCHRLKGDFCGDCSACRRMESGTFPDYHLIEPDGALITIDQMREMIAEATLRPYEAPRKLFVLDPADRMKLETANSLLKVLEEPFPFSMFILITSSPRAILPTIESRCQKIRFSPMPYELLAEQLRRRHALDTQTAEIIARISGGRPGLAEQLAQGDFLAERDAVIESLATIAKNRTLEVLRIGQKVRGRDNAARFLQLLIPVLRDAVILKEQASPEALLNRDRAEQIAQATQEFSQEELAVAWQNATDGVWNLMQNANPQAQLDRVLLPLCSFGSGLARFPQEAKRR